MVWCCVQKHFQNHYRKQVILIKLVWNYWLQNNKDLCFNNLISPEMWPFQWWWDGHLTKSLHRASEVYMYMYSCKQGWNMAFARSPVETCDTAGQLHVKIGVESPDMTMIYMIHKRYTCIKFSLRYCDCKYKLKSKIRGTFFSFPWL